MRVGFKSDKGKMRPNNEDACFVMLSDKVYIIADGVGGGNAGEIASRTAVREIASYIEKHPMTSLDSKYAVVSHIQKCIDEANNEIFQMALKHEENNGMATTLVLAYVYDGHLIVANVGDSRVYLFRDGELFQLTEDHTYVNTLVHAGIITKEQAEVDERKNMITKALGAESKVEPDYYQIEIEVGDKLLLCTDGLYDEVEKDRMISILSKKISMPEMCTEFVNEANKNGGRDNITIITLEVTREDLNER